jgi:RNA polymerase sigma factor (sigma-70 family)
MADGGLHAALGRLRRAVGPSDVRAEDVRLLARFAADRDPAAFEQLLERHGPMVRGVCRRILRHEQDAEDAFQATFLALSRSAGTLGRGSLAGWLYRAAYHAALKAKARAARRREVRAPNEVAADGDPAPSAGMGEVRAVIDAEVTRLPERLRLPVVLCYFEGRSNSEAAAELGCPRGTVDSRLNAARAKLKARLIRRGVAPAAAMAFLERLAGGEAAGAALSAATIRAAARSSLAFTSGSAGADGVISPAAAALAHEVLHMVFINKLKWAALMVLALGLVGTGGVSTYRALADGDPGQAKAPPAARPAEDKGAALVARAEPAPTARQLRQLLKAPAGLEKPIDNISLREALEHLSNKFDVTIRIDPVPFAPYGVLEPFKLYDQSVSLPVVRGLTVGDALRDILAQIKHENTSIPGLVTYVVKGSQIAIVPAFMTPYSGAIGSEKVDGDGAILNRDIIEEQFLGDRVSIDYQDKPLAEVLRDLADMTGANIVLDNRQKDKGATPITLTLQQVKLFKALQVIADMADLQPVALHNVYYVTTPENAKRLEKREFPQPDPPPPGLGGMILGAAPPAPATPKP